MIAANDLTAPEPSVRHFQADRTQVTRLDHWRLTIHYFPAATAAGRTPIPHDGFEPEWLPEWYKPREIDFANPPSRQDFLNVVAQTPWMQVWEDDLLPLIEQNQWPMVDSIHRGATVDLIDSSGKVVGRLEVWREHLYRNIPYVVPIIWRSNIDTCLNRRIRDQQKREEARRYLDANRNLILERLSQCEDQSITQVLKEVGRVLVEGGFLGQPKARRGEPVAAK